MLPFFFLIYKFFYSLFSWTFQRLQKSKLCADAAILDESLLRRCLNFYSVLSMYLLKVADPQNMGYAVTNTSLLIGANKERILKLLLNVNDIIKFYLLLHIPLLKILIKEKKTIGIHNMHMNSEWKIFNWKKLFLSVKLCHCPNMCQCHLELCQISTWRTLLISFCLSSSKCQYAYD